ncbi:hypothetical protein D3Z45_06155 [Lachnospiraceae bacterium]|nr:hypothetical protein [Lachnospiraceae bacterium]
MIYRPISSHPYDLGLPRARDSGGGGNMLAWGELILRKALDGEAAETCKTFHLLNKCVWIGQVSPLHDRQISDIVITLYF